MLWNASTIHGYAIAASDGSIGTVSDFLFDDSSWRIRWLVVDTGNWLSAARFSCLPRCSDTPIQRRASSRCG
ncbi:MAG: PRC-barrel domain-containing protein [Bauldia sp.]